MQALVLGKKNSEKFASFLYCTTFSCKSGAALMETLSPDNRMQRWLKVKKGNK